MGGAGDLFAGGEGDPPGGLVLDGEDAEAAELDAGAGDQAGDEVVEEGLDDPAGEVQGKTEVGGDGFGQVVLDHPGQWESTHFWIKADRSAVSLAGSASSCLKRNGRSEVEPVAEAMASATSAARMVGRFSFLALTSAALATASARAVRRSMRQAIASAPTRSSV